MKSDLMDFILLNKRNVIPLHCNFEMKNYGNEQ